MQKRPRTRNGIVERAKRRRVADANRVHARKVTKGKAAPPAPPVIPTPDPIPWRNGD